MPRRIRRRRYALARPVKTAKYSNETFSFSGQLIIKSDAAQSTVALYTPILPDIGVHQFLGTRKAKNFTIRFNIYRAFDEATESLPVFFEPGSIIFALVYVPEGNLPSEMNIGTYETPTSMYDPNQNVICSGIASGNTPTVVKTRLARNLNSNDQIYLIAQSTIASPGTGYTTLYQNFVCTVNFAISF